MKNRYRHEMEGLGPSPEELRRLYTMISMETKQKRTRQLSWRSAVALACAVLMATVAAAAVIPAVRETLQRQLGAFAPYVQPVEGAMCQDQGVEIQVLGALSDDLEARVYFSVQDMEGDRLDECLTLKGQLITGEKKETEESSEISVSSVGTSYFQLISYDPETRTALFSASVYYGEQAQPRPDAQVSITGMTTQEGKLYANASCSAVTGNTLESLPAGAKDRVIFRPSDVVNSPCTDEVLPQNLVVLAPDQNPMPLADTQDMWISSMGFASDGYFHVRLGFAEGVTPEEGGFFCDLFQSGSWDDRLFVCQQTLVEGGMDILFPLIRRDDLALIQRCKARFYGPYTRLGQSIEGSWTASFQMEHYPSAVLDWTGELLGRQVRKVTVSPLSVTMYSNDSGGFHSTPLYAVRKDGTTVAAEPDTGRYSAPVLEGESLVQDAFNTWKFEEPVNVADIAGLRLEDETIPVN